MIRAGVARNARQLLDRSEDGVGAAVGDLEVVALITIAATSQHANETADAVIHMYQVVARGESLRRLTRDATTMHGWSTNTRRPEEFAVGDHRQPIHAALESAVESTRQDRQ